ncbi:hypothetical protein [Cellvibrio japonicus]|uniref:hypothetical protein n=1 Tax=Cellvibrio japonicus TaxID=155077 RepID=UPI0005A137A6|nr:hypothetical protein [Cellvibrio japonicus]QEI12892.1 hypothetical protein FY117_12085 [Cellvibrio japonicus]QEI16466.1 hypothetical protein FY116_12090 [Cellvibrio japonicus]QEI20044.1 hypothetical protein FY115_12085 [Cellvibrio japonicus]
MKNENVTVEYSLDDKKKKIFSLILMFILGILIVSIAALLEDSQFIKTVLTPIGGVIIGFGLTSVISLVFSPTPFEGVLRMINELLLIPWRSKEEELIPFRRRFFGYLYTTRDGVGKWIYRDFDFGNAELPGYLHATIQYPLNVNTTAKYQYYGFPVKNRLILIGVNSHLKNEPAVVQIIPKYGQSGIYAGLAILETISGENIITPTLLSAEKLVDINNYGVINDAEAESHLNRLWKREFKSSLHLLPE